jgi:hypothetical protein
MYIIVIILICIKWHINRATDGSVLSKKTDCEKIDLLWWLELEIPLVLISTELLAPGRPIRVLSVGR